MPGTVLITGASSGIGLELARECTRHGHGLVLVARRADRLEEAAAELRERVQVEVVVSDLSERNACQALYDRLDEREIEVDYLVNNAGFGLYGPFVEGDAARQQEMIALMIAALTQLTRLFAADMRARRRGRVLNVASTAAFQPGPMMAVYFATKAYVLHFSEAIDNELKGTGVRVTALCPGSTESEFAETAQADRSLIFTMRTLPTSADVARYGYRVMRGKKRVAIHGLLNKFLVQAVRLTPRSLVTAIARRMMAD
ncbi:MAG: SDR family oxidoreductase [Pseudomonadota bacterium]|nr:SDR family oxidoreductase [Pseudomonadota bacterium]